MRLEGVAKMGYYPTPESQVAKIMLKLDWEGPSRLFDPCAGAGAALAQIVQIAPVGSHTYGIEIDGQRASQARELLDHVVHCAYEVARVEDNSMNLLFLNPPYDAQAGLGGNVMRKELIFLRHLSKKLAADGILAFVIPQYVISNEMVDTLSQRFTDLAIYRFDDEEYEVYKQVVIFGRKRATQVFALSKLTEEERNFRNELIAYGQDLTMEMLYLHEDLQIWLVPQADEKPFIFRGAIHDEKELVLDIAQSDTFAIAENLLLSTTKPSTLSRPLLPYRTTHMATLIASGSLNGSIGIGENRHLVVGMTKKKIDISREIHDNGNETILETESFITAVRTFEQDGTIRNLGVPQTPSLEDAQTQQ
jgi:Uncharacterised methyltransferase family (DUF6094)